MKLDLFKKIEEINESELHPKFKLLRDSVQLSDERQILIDWTEDFIDRDNKIIKRISNYLPFKFLGILFV